MRLSLQIAGGIAAPVTARRYEVDVASLPAAKQEEVQRLVAQAVAEPRGEGNPRLRDAMSYELTIHSDRGETTLVADDGAVPPRLRQLIDLVKSLGAPARP
jgi:hypothetical protein